MRNAGSNSYVDNVQVFLSLNYTLTRMISALSAIVISLHVVACLWYFLARVDDFSPDTWVVRYGYLDADI